MDVEKLQQVLLDAARERSQAATLHVLVGGLAGEPGVALARIWLVGPGDVCADCRLRSECPDQAQCLHLVASDGPSRRTGEEWTRTDGPSERDRGPADGAVVPLAKMKKLEEQSIRTALKRTRGKLYGPGGAAELLGIKGSTLASRMKALGIDKPRVAHLPDS